MKPLPLAILVLATLMAALGSAHAQDYPKLAPYSAIRWDQEVPEVQIDGVWYGLRSIDGLVVDKIVEFAKERHGQRWQKRFGEDLVQVLSEMGQPPGTLVQLVLRDLSTGREKTRDKVPMTEENRRAIMLNNRAAELPPPSADGLKPEQLHRALDEFEAALNERWAYRHANQADYPSAVKVLRKRIGAGISPAEFGIELQKIIALGIDGHAGVTGYVLPSEGFLPFLVEPDGERFVAFRSDRSGFLSDGFPYLTKIDGKAVGEWIEAAAALVPKGSPQFVRQQCLRLLRDLDYIRGVLGVPKSSSVQLELTASNAKDCKTVSLPLAQRRPTYGTWPRASSALHDGKVGYLRLPNMDATTSVQEIKKWMPEFRSTGGMVVDVRDNGGGSREALILLYSYLAAPSDPPRVITTAAYRLHEGYEADHLARRFMYRAEASEWTKAERQAIGKFAQTFSPEWQPPEGDFSEWHYLVLSRIDDPEVYHYKKPVVVLMNAKCFSATDIFLAGLKGMRNVTLLGSPSGGGSSFPQPVLLGETGLLLEIGSMVSFQADGRLFDGHGVHPDVLVEPLPAYYIGGQDNLLMEALQRIAAQ